MHFLILKSAVSGNFTSSLRFYIHRFSRVDFFFICLMGIAVILTIYCILKLIAVTLISKII